ncbi:DNA polymerase III subunit alpha, partial [Candidatus Neomarinimicrobiota bacterium]
QYPEESGVLLLRDKGIEIDPENVPLDDPDTYAVFARGQTIGVFQFESSGMREFLTKLQPTVIEDLIAMNALYRPGPMAFIDEFIDRKHGRREITYLHPDLKPILEETYGVIVYQEQVMQIANIIAGFTLAQADIMRRAMGKKKKEVMAHTESDFIQGAEARQIPRDIARAIFELIAKFAEYGFNKSHSTAYALVAYQTAWLKAHYPAEFMAANLSSEMSNPDRVPILMAEAKALGLEIVPPNVNVSGSNFMVDDQKRIVFGLNAIKHVGARAADHIRKSRPEGGWQNLPAFLTNLDLHLVNRKAVECLIKSGACDALEGTRAQQFAYLDSSIRYAQGVQGGSNSSQASLFSHEGMAEVIPIPPVPDIDSWTPDEQYHMEKELTGYFLSGHPLSAHDDDLREFNNYDFVDPREGLRREQLRMGGLVSQLKLHHARKGLPMAFFTLEGLLGNLEVVVFSDLYAKVKPLLEADARVFVIGKPTQRTGPPGQNLTVTEHPSIHAEVGPNGDSIETATANVKILAEDIFPLVEVRQRLARQVNIRLMASAASKGTADQLKTLSEAYRGSSELRIHITDDSGAPAYKNDGNSPVGNLPGYPTRRIRATNIKVAPTSEFLTRLRDIVGPKNVWVSF